MRKFKKVIGCGGIGKGMLFYSLSNETLGRSESRLVELSDAKDYCKLQIVFYYTSMLVKNKAEVFPVGYVGKDATGEELISLFDRQGMNTTGVKFDAELPTMISICLQYPDTEGCNFTANNSALSKVTPDIICEMLESIGVDKQTIVAAIPEISVESRCAMISYGKKHGAFTVISIPQSEAKAFENLRVYDNCDLVSVNEEEARSMCGSLNEGMALAEDTLEYLSQFQQDIKLCLTMGGKGSYAGDRQHGMRFIPSYPAKVVNTTGAGDAYVGTLMGALVLGIPFFPEKEADVGTTAPELAAICSGLAVESPDSIPQEITKQYILSQLKNKEMKHNYEKYFK